MLTSSRVCFYTAIAALVVGSKISLSFLKDGPASDFRPMSVLILGGSSALGAATIQLLRLALPQCSILVTSSPAHHDHLKSLGASTAVGRTLSGKEIKSQSPESRGIDLIIDVVGAGVSQPDIFDAFDQTGSRRYAQVWTGDDEVKVPSGVESVLFRSRDLSTLQGGKNIMLALENLLEEGKYKLPLPVKVVGQGFNVIMEGLDLMRKGVSGEKLIVAI
jgi:NADPH:quinone reductase-like Zn-dependent oxidoreductase